MEKTTKMNVEQNTNLTQERWLLMGWLVERSNKLVHDVLTKFGVDSKINLRVNLKVNWMSEVNTKEKEKYKWE